MQIDQGKLNAVRTLSQLFTEGQAFAGLSAALARQAVYSSIRFGVYDELKKSLGVNTSLPKQVACGMLAGGIGAFIANPLDLSLVRMQADGKAEPHLRRGYKHVFDALFRVCKEEGVLTLWRGSSMTMSRACVITASQFVGYDVVKQAVVSDYKLMKEGTPAHLASGIAAGFIASCTSTPFDTIKTRLMSAPKGLYSGMFDCLTKTVKEGGPMAVFKGFGPTAVRQVPYVVTMFISLEKIKQGFKYYDDSLAV